ncbi:MAG: GrpB family protein [Fibrobacter sp.]|nr:GrpB family protein [Fibrobacter sp.]
MKKSLHQMTKEELGKLFPIILSEYQENWKQLYQDEKEVITEFIGKNLIEIDHIGSTSVPGIMAKPTIDILVQIDDSTDLEEFIEKFKNHGYNYIPQSTKPAPGMMYTKGYSENGFVGQTYHVHVRYQGDWEEICFRDYLIRHPEIAREYVRLKLLLQEKYRNDRELYTEGKGEFIRRVCCLAREEDM